MWQQLCWLARFLPCVLYKNGIDKKPLKKKKNLISQQGVPQSPETLSLCSVGLRPPAQARLTNLLTQLPFISGYKMDREKTKLINQWLHPHAPSLEPSLPGEEGKLINISLGFEVLPLPGPRKIMHKRWPTNLGFPPASKRSLSDIAALFLSVNHVYYWNFRERVRERTKNIM